MNRLVIVEKPKTRLKRIWLVLYKICTTNVLQMTDSRNYVSNIMDFLWFTVLSHDSWLRAMDSLIKFSKFHSDSRLRKLIFCLNGKKIKKLENINFSYESDWIYPPEIGRHGHPCPRTTVSTLVRGHGHLKNQDRGHGRGHGHRNFCNRGHGRGHGLQIF